MRSGGVWIGLLAVVAACTGHIGGGGGDDDDDGAAPDVAFIAPAPGDEFVRDTLAPAGWRVAEVPVAVVVAGADTVEIAGADEVLGVVDDAGELIAPLRTAGPATLIARALRDGAVVAEASIDIAVVEPDLPDCHAWLDLYGLTYEDAGETLGVADPVTLATPVNGLAWRYAGNLEVRTSFAVVDCTLARSLAEAAPYLRARGIVEVADIGVYNYRCIGEGTPPDCPNGMSQHAHAKAIDIAGLTDAAGTFYSVDDDWVIDPDTEPTCDAATEPGADDFLHRTICELKAAGIWNIVLTPNYDADHRNHIHVDLTPDADFIEKTALPTE